MSLLVVDDETNIHSFFEMLLDGHPYEVDCVGTAEEALERLQKQHYRLAIVDKNLPGIDGLSMIRALRHAQVDLRFMMITGYPTFEAVLEALRLGVSDFLRKPFVGLEELRSRIAIAAKTPTPKELEAEVQRLGAGLEVGKEAIHSAASILADETQAPEALPHERRILGVLEKAEKSMHEALNGPHERGDQEPMTRILLVDDETSVQAYFEALLDDGPYAIDAASTAEEALELLQFQNYQLAIVDKNLPGMNGLELIRILRGAQMDLRFVVITAYSSMEAAEEALRLGVVEFLPKPFGGVEEVRQKIDAAAASPSAGGLAGRVARLRTGVGVGMAALSEASEILAEASEQEVSAKTPRIREVLERAKTVLTELLAGSR